MRASTFLTLALPILAAAVPLGQYATSSLDQPSTAADISSLGKISTELAKDIRADDATNAMALESDIESTLTQVEEDLAESVEDYDTAQMSEIVKAFDESVRPMGDAMMALIDKAPKIKEEKPKVIPMVHSAMADLQFVATNAYGNIKSSKNLSPEDAKTLETDGRILNEAFREVLEAYPAN